MKKKKNKIMSLVQLNNDIRANARISPYLKLTEEHWIVIKNNISRIITSTIKENDTDIVLDLLHCSIEPEPSCYLTRDARWVAISVKYLLNYEDARICAIVIDY